MSAAARIFRAFESEPAKAEAIVDALDAYQERKDALTRAEFQKETWEIRAEIEKVRADVEKVRADLRTEIEKVRADLHQAINRQVIWIIVAVSVMIGILKGLDILLK